MKKTAQYATKAAFWMVEIINILLIPVLIFIPIVLPTSPGGNKLTAAMLPIGIVYLWVPFFGILLSQKFCQLSEAESERRDFLLHYYPIWSILSFIGFLWILTTSLNTHIF